MCNNSKIKVLIVEDHKILGEGLASLIRTEPNLVVSGFVSSAEEAMIACYKSKPDLIIMDVSLPEMDGIELTRILTKKNPLLQVIILTMHSRKPMVQRAFKAGAKGFLLKESAYKELIMAINAVMSNKKYMSPLIGKIDEHTDLNCSKYGVLAKLTSRELEICEYLAEGWGVRAIAQHLFLSHKTVEAHRSNIMKKTNVTSVSVLTKLAIKEGLIIV